MGQMTTPAAAELSPFVPPPYPYERLDGLLAIAAALPGGAVDFSIGTPMDPPPAAVVQALSTSDSERGYPSSPGSAELRRAIVDWIGRRFGVAIVAGQVAACVGTKEFVGTLPQWLRLRRPGRDTVLYPEIAYPTYEMGAILGGCRPVAVPLTAEGRLALDAVAESDVARALVLWVNSPGNPTGACEDLGAVAEWGRARDVPVFSDECYVEFTWRGSPQSSPSTHCRSGPTAPGSASASTPAMRRSSTTCSRSASTSE
jgi:aspartate/methionine/tyrosine aminotransferase